MIALSVAWSFLRSPLGRLLAGAVALLLLLAVVDARGYQRGVKAERGRWEARLEADAAKARATEAKNAQAGQAASERVEKAREIVRWRTEYITQRIPYAIDPARPALPVWFVSLHDEAAVGVPIPSDRAGEPDLTASTVTDAQALKVIAENYGACRFDQGRLAELQGLLKTWGMAP